MDREPRVSHPCEKGREVGAPDRGGPHAIAQWLIRFCLFQWEYGVPTNSLNNRT
jgi:hypothetical protein